MKKNLLIVMVLCGVGILVGCGSGGDPTYPNIGFSLQADRYEVSQTTGTTLLFPTTYRVIGNFIEPQGTILGTSEIVNDTFTAFQIYPGRKVPAKWSFTYIEVNQIGRRPCSPLGGTVERNVNPGETEPLSCYARVFPITVSPSLIDAQSPPNKISLQVEGINNIYAAPQVAILDEFGNVKASMASTIMNLAKGEVEIDTPNLTQFRNGRYQVSINNVRSDGSWDTIGVAQIFIFNLIDPDNPTHTDPCANQAPECLF